MHRLSCAVFTKIEVLWYLARSTNNVATFRSLVIILLLIFYQDFSVANNLTFDVVYLHNPLLSKR